MKIRLHWIEREDYYRFDPTPDVLGPQVFAERPQRHARAMIDLGTSLVLSYDAWQALGGPIDIDVAVTPA